MAEINKVYLKEHKLFRKRNKNIIAIFFSVAILVAIIVFWCLKIVGITVTSEALCNLEDHFHVTTCYSDGKLICAKPEHTHSSECFPKNGTDVETSYDWKKTFEKVNISNDIVENLISIAGTQVGYKESTYNYEYNALAEKHSYTRYGEWYGSAYGEWNTLFVSFCLNYSNINNVDSLVSASAENMRCAWEEKNLYFSADEYNGSRGDIVFFDTNSDQKADRTAIALSKSKDILIVIEGDVDGAVDEAVYQNFDNILGYGKTSSLYEAEHILNSSEKYSNETSVKAPELSGRINKYIPSIEENPVMFKMTKNTPLPDIYDSEPLMLMSYIDDDYNIDEEFTLDEGIIFTSELEQEIIHASIKTLSGVELSDGASYTVIVSPDDNHTFDVKFENDYIETLAKGTKLTVYYSAKLNEKAKIVDDGNDNTVYLSYGEDSIWETSEHTTTTYTWKMDVLKFTKEGENKIPLAGAEFQLLDKDDNPIKFSQVAGATVPTYMVDAEGTITNIVTDENGKFEFVGLDEGVYALHEVEAPEGYNKLATDMEVVVTSDYSDADLTAEYQINDASPATIEVENKTGGIFPETGGIGTTIFYSVGALLMLVAVVIFVSKKRMATFS